MLQNVTQVPPATLLAEAAAKGYLVTLRGDALSPGLVDLTNPGARAWYAQVIAQNLLADPARGGGGLSGFMADFGESLPLAAGLGLYDPAYAGLTPAQLHNAWPLLWQTLCEEAAVLAQAQGLLPNGTTADDIVFFTRSAAAQTPGHTRCVESARLRLS
jgi:alpha-glucosidase (family GH31 glycosyl hydrolase)